VLNSANVRANNDYRRPTEPHRYLLCGAGPGANSTSRQVQSATQGEGPDSLRTLSNVKGNRSAPSLSARVTCPHSSQTNRSEPTMCVSAIPWAQSCKCRCAVTFPQPKHSFVTIFLLITPQSRTQRNGPLRTRRHRWESNSDVVLVQSFTIGRVLCTQYCELTLRQMAAHKMKCSKQEVNCPVETQYEERSAERSVASA